MLLWPVCAESAVKHQSTNCITCVTVETGWGESTGSKEAVYTCGDGSRAAGAQSVQTGTARAAGECAVGRNDPSVSRTVWHRQWEEKIVNMELVSCV